MVHGRSQVLTPCVRAVPFKSVGEEKNIFNGGGGCQIQNFAEFQIILACRISLPPTLKFFENCESQMF